jgi:hypothetical protein
MPAITDTVTKTQEQVVEAIKAAQAQIVEATRKAVSRLESALPEQAKTLPYAQRLPKLTTAVDTPFVVAQKVLDNQRDFVKAIAGAASPLVGQRAVRTKAGARASANAKSSAKSA